MSAFDPKRTFGTAISAKNKARRLKVKYKFSSSLPPARQLCLADLLSFNTGQLRRRDLTMEHHDVGFEPINRSAFRDLDVGIENRSRCGLGYGDRTFLLSSRIR